MRIVFDHGVENHQQLAHAGDEDDFEGFAFGLQACIGSWAQVSWNPSTRPASATNWQKREMPFQRRLSLPVMYDDLRLDAALRLDLLVDDRVIVELKAIESLTPLNEAQLLTYLRLTKKRLGLLINFNVPLLKNGIKRMVL